MATARQVKLSSVGRRHGGSCFWMAWEDFCTYFDAVGVCRFPGRPAPAQQRGAMHRCTTIRGG
jgi:hypothetical protein